MVAGSAQAAEKLRLLTWADYAPADIVQQFKKETGIDVEITLSNNEEMISKLRATQGAGFDLAQPSQDRIAGPQQEFGIYKPMDLSKLKSDLFIPSMLEATKKNTTLDGKVYGVPAHLGHRRPRREHQAGPEVADYPDLCSAAVQGQDQLPRQAPDADRLRVRQRQGSVRAYSDPKAYAALMDDVGAKLAECKRNVKFFWDNKDQLLNALRTGEIVGAMVWDTGGWKLNAENAGHPVHRAEVGRAGLDRHVRDPGEGPQRRRRLRVDQLQHAARDRREGRGVGRQLHRLQRRRQADGRQAQGAVRRELSRRPRSTTSNGIRRCRPASRRSRARCSTA